MSREHVNPNLYMRGNKVKLSDLAKVTQMASGRTRILKVYNLKNDLYAKHTVESSKLFSNNPSPVYF